MAELIDLLFLFWFFVTAAVYIVGNIYENHLKEKAKAEARRQRRLESISRVQDWRPNDEIASRSASQYNSSPRYDNNYTALATQEASNQHRVGASNFTTSQNSSLSAGQNAPFSAHLRQTDFSINYDLGSSNAAAAGYIGREPSLYDGPNSYDLRAQAKPGDQPIPTATGFNGDCVDWVNRILFLFYSQPKKYGPIIAENVYRSLNEKLSNILSSSAQFGHLTMEFRWIDVKSSSKPELRNVRTESESDKSLSAVCKIYNQRLVCDLRIREAPADSARAPFGAIANDRDRQHIDYELTLENLEGKLKSVAMLNDKLIVVQFMEKPDTKILLRQTSGPSSPINEDTLVSLILQTLTQVVVDLYFGDDLDFPHFVKQPTTGGYKNRLNQLKGSASEIKRHIKQDFLGALSLSSQDSRERKIFVKLVRAKNINYNQNVTCILELDQPLQHAISSTKLGSNPFWDEHFLFLVNEKSLGDKLTLELWDSLDPSLSKAARQLLRQQECSAGKQQRANKSANSFRAFNKNELTASGKFLGSAQLSIDELRQSPVQRQSLQLSQHPEQELEQVSAQANMIGGLNLSDSIGGELELELMFMEHSSQVGRPIQKSASASSLNSLLAEQGDVVSVDRKLTQSGYLITTTTISKPASQQLRGAGSRDRLSPTSGGRVGARNYSPVSSATEQSEAAMMEVSSLDGLSGQVSQRSADQSSQQHQVTDGRDSRSDGRMSRSRSRSRDLLRAIKRRFSFSRGPRSRSVSESASPSRARAESNFGARQGNSNTLDAISIDSRSRDSSELSISGRAKSMPASRDSNEVPTIVINKSRLSDASSAFTFGQPKSQLVIECTEPKMSGLDGSSSSKDKTLLRHYAIPDDRASERRWRRRGLKLHLFNEHQFVACHLAGSSTCHLCGRVFSRRPGKQGYKCRNCHLLSHKQCHVKVDHNCPYATKDSLKLEYIDADPPASLVFEKAHSASSKQQKASRPSSRLATKSISVEVDDR